MYDKTTLDNGLRIITNSMLHTRSVSVCIYLGVGARYETEAEAGISHFIEHLMFRGTQKRPFSKDISAAIEGVGGIINGGTDKEITVYWCKVAQPHFETALDVLADMILNSRLDPDDIEKERRVIIEEIGMSLDTPQQLVGMRLDEILWPKHPLGRDVAGTRETISGIKRQQILDFIEEEYSPLTTVVSIAGNIDSQSTVELVRKLFGGWKTTRPCRDYTPYVENYNPRLALENKETEQTHLCLALPGVSLLDPRRFTADLLNVILGEGMSSRLFLEVRDKLGLVYNIHSYTDHFLDSGALTVYAGVDPQNLETGIQAILNQLQLLKEPVSTEELNKARELSKGRLLLRMEDSRSVAGWMGGQETLNRKVLTVEEVVNRIDAVTAEGIAQYACETMVGANLRLSVVGPVKDEDRLLNLMQI